MTERIGGSSEMADRVRAFDWAATALGAIAAWPERLAGAVEAMLAAPQLASLAIGPDRVFLYNDAASRYYGDRYPALLGKPIAHAFAHEFAAVEGYYDRVFAGESLHVPAQPLDPARKGTPEVFDAYMSPVRNSDGDVVAAYMTGFAVTDRHITEAKLRDSEKRVRAVVQQAPLAIAFTGPSGEIVFRNAMFDALWGRPAHETTAATYSDVYEGYHLDGRPIASEEWPGARAVLHGETVHDEVLEIIQADGRRVACAFSAGPIREEDDRITGGVVLFRDVSDERRTQQALRDGEERFRTLSDNMSQLAWTCDRLGEVTWYNQRWLDYTGLTFDEMKDWGWERVQHPDHVDRVVAGVTRSRDRGEMWEDTFPLRRHDGTYRWFLSHAMPIRDAQGEIVRWFGTNTDITDQREAEAALRESEERQAFLLRLGDAMRAAEDADILIVIASRMLGERLDASRIVFAEIDAPAGIATIRPGWTASGAEQHPATLNLADFGGPLLDDLRAGRTVRYDDVGPPPYARPDLAALAAIGIRAGLSVPLLVGGRFVVNLNVHQHAPRAWTDAEVTLVEEVAERIWAAVQRARAEAAVRASEERLAAELRGTELLRDLAERLVPEESSRTFYEEILSAAIAIVHADAGTVQVYDAATASLFLLVSRGFAPNMTDHFERVDAGSSTACGIALTTNARTVVDFDDETDEAARMHVEAGYHSAQATPLLSREGAPLGMLNTHWSASGHRPSTQELRFLDLLARQAADLIEARQAREALRESEERLREFGEASQDILWIRDAETLQWQYLTPAFEAIYGLSRDEALTGDDYRNWQDLIVPEDRDHAVASIARVRDGEHVTFQFRVRRPSDGAIRWLRNTDFPIRDASGKIVLIGGIGHDLTQLKRAEERQATLLAELQHRVRNILAVTRSIISRSDDGERSTEEYVQHLQGRIAALARTQVLLTRAAGSDIDLDSLIRDELLAQVVSWDQVTIEGADVHLSPKVAEVLTLAIHELATNATKYGAFSKPDGRLDVRWHVEDRESQDWLVLDWTEHGVPIVDAAPRHRGFGAELISRRIPYELKGHGSLELKPGGVESHIEFPLVAGESILQTDAGGR